MKAFYFSNTDRRLRFRDNRKIHLGETHTVKGRLMMCERGLHASKNILDALDYAPGPVIYIVNVSAEIVGDDKICSRSRTYVRGGIDIRHILLKFARMCLLDAINPQKTPDIIIRYLKTGGESLMDNVVISIYNGSVDRGIRNALEAIIFAGNNDVANVAKFCYQTVLWFIQPDKDTRSWASDSAIASCILARDAAIKKQEQRLRRMVMRAIRKQEKQND
jgi:hypothetical protein